MLFLSLFILNSLIINAREITVTVLDADLDLPLEGALVRSWNNTEHSADKDGRVVLDVPDTRPVVIHAAYPGYESARFLIDINAREFTAALRLAGTMEGRELVIEGRRPAVSETKPGRSTALSEEDMTRTSEIGLIEDVMASVKLLPGVGYAGFFNALPSIRGGDPQDMSAAMDGYYVESPYHWGGGFSIFDPKMVKSARLSHGVFSSRYGHTISGLLEITSRKPSPTETELELGVSTSAFNVNASLPFSSGKGGVLFMGKITYWDPFVSAAKLFVEEAKAVTKAPYIRSGAVSANYRFNSNLEWTLSSFLGSDGIGIDFEAEYDELGIEGDSGMVFNWDNYLGFLISSLTFNPNDTMVLKITGGTGFHHHNMEAEMTNDITVDYSRDFIDKYGPTGLNLNLSPGGTYTLSDIPQTVTSKDTSIYAQGRLDFDWDLGGGFIFSSGGEELYSRWLYNERDYILMEEEPGPLFNPLTDTLKLYYVDFTSDVKNHGFESSLYSLLEFQSENRRFGAELGVRADHLYFVGKDFTLQTMPVVNPRINFDFTPLRNRGALEGLTLTLGTGLFSSMNRVMRFIEEKYNVGDFDYRPTRSWTSVVGVKMDFSGGYSFTVEGYYKYIYDRTYVSATTDPLTHDINPLIGFDGEGRVWGFDLMLQKFNSRYWDGWLAYSFNVARYRDPGGIENGISVTGGELNGSDWYYPAFHRFHNLNLVINYKPTRIFRITTRLGFASGAPERTAGDIISYPVEVAIDGYPPGMIIEKWQRTSEYSDTARGNFALPLDVKFSFLGFNKKGRVQSEMYFAVENALVMILPKGGTSSFNSYTGREETGSSSASYTLPIPMISLGFKWSY